MLLFFRATSNSTPTAATLSDAAVTTLETRVVRTLGAA